MFFFDISPPQILQLRRELGLKQEEFAKRLDVNQSTVSKWETGRNRPEGDEQIRLLSLWEEVFGDGAAKPERPKERRMSMSITRDEPDEPDIPEIDVVAGAGLGGEAILENFSANGRDITSADTVRSFWRLPAGYLSHELRVKRSAARIITIEGDSMAPTLLSGDRVIVDVDRRAPSPPGIFALWDGLGVVVKRLEYISLSDPAAVRIISDNAAHPVYERTVEEANIIGRVIWYGRRL